MQKNFLSESFLFSGGVNFDNEPFTTYIVDTTIYVLLDIQGRRNRFSLGGARIIRKMTFCEFSKILLSKSSILQGARAPPGPPPLVKSILLLGILFLNNMI